MKVFAWAISPRSRKVLRLARWTVLIILALMALLLLVCFMSRLADWFTGFFPHLSPLWEDSRWSR